MDQLDIQSEVVAPAVDPEALPAKTLTIYDLLRARYEAPEWALMREVAPATGGGTRYADGVAVNLWRSRGHAIHGFEVKVSRSDWLRELKQPEKAEPVSRYCDYWWIVTEKDVIKPGELPPTWGHLQRRGNGLAVIVAAPQLEAEPPSRAFFASLLRRGFELLDVRAEELVAGRKKALDDSFEERLQQRMRWEGRELEGMKKAVAKFEAETGLKLREYHDPSGMIRLAKLLEGLQGYGSDGTLDRLRDLVRELDRAAEIVRKAVDESGLAPAKGG